MSGGAAADDPSWGGPLTALAFELIVGTPERFHCGKQIASYLGLVPGKIPVASGADWDTSASRATSATVSAGGSGAGHVRSHPMAQPVLPPGPATRAEDREGSHGSQAGGASVLDVASGDGLRPLAKLGSHAGEPGNPHGVQ